ncbi:NucA/NucB deoxyribonuclease domain-containing protein [Amycolatopsis nivea]
MTVFLSFSLLHAGAAEAARRGNDTSAGSTAAVDRVPRLTRPFTIDALEGCQAVLDRVKNHAMSAQGKVPCASQRLAEGSSSLRIFAQDPDLCHPEEVNMTRHQVCGLGTIPIDVIDVKTGAVTGGLDLNQLGFMFTDYDKIDWQYSATQTFTEIWGDGAGTTVAGEGWCTGDCKVSYQSWPTLIATEETRWEGYVMGESTTFQPGQSGYGTLGARTTLTNPKWSNAFIHSGDAPRVRCDNVFATSRAAGCVLPDVTPEIFYELNGPYPELALHIKEAQAKGLPGVYGGKPLTRTMKESVQEENNKKACPPSLPRPPGEDCDEYPFKSTWQGAAYGPYDIKMINARQNQDGGRALQEFYYQERVIEEDPFWVGIV